MEKPTKITMCGSSRFVQQMAVAAWILERDQGALVMGLHLLPWWYSVEEIPDHLAEHENCAARMDELHLRKIDESDEIFVVDMDHYIGDSTRREIAYATAHGKKVRWLTHPDERAIYEEIVDRLGKGLAASRRHSDVVLGSGGD